MLFIFKLILLVVGLFVALTIVSGLSLAVRIRQAMQNPFDREHDNPTSSSARADVIEGEYKVIHEEKDND